MKVIRSITSGDKIKFSEFRVLICCTILIFELGNTSTFGLSQMDFYKRDTSTISHFLTTDPLEGVRKMTSRAVISATNKGGTRILSVYSASLNGFIEFGFPPRGEQLSLGTLEIIDVTFATSGMLNAGDRLVAIKHACANVYMTCDKYGQLRACNHKHDSGLRILTTAFHCISAISSYSCPSSPYVILEPARKYDIDNSVENQYKLRFESPVRDQPTVFYATVSRLQWVFRLRSQASILDGAIHYTILKLWPMTVRTLFSKTVHRYNRRMRRNNNRNREEACKLDPATIRDNIIRNLTWEEIDIQMQKDFVNDDNIKEVQRHVAWFHMTMQQKKLFVEKTSSILRLLLRNALLAMGDISCMQTRQWGKLSWNQRSYIIDRYLTSKWLEHRIETGIRILDIFHSYLNKKITTFTIEEIK